jgi:parallel beta-helix repeat protein
LFILVSTLLAGAVVGLFAKGVLAADYTDVSVTEAKAMIDQKPALVILDVRNQSEYDAGHIRNAKLIPVWQLASRLDELNKNDEILVYCKKGARSANASITLIDHGFSDIFNMLGGIDAWINATYPVYIKYSSIQGAIDNATAGDVINVSIGNYSEHLIIDKPLTLEGENETTTIIDGGGNGTVIDVSSENVTITDFTIQGSGCSCADYAGVYVRPWSSNLNLTENNIEHDGYGVKLAKASNTIIHYNEIVENSFGIEILLSSGNSIVGNKIAWNGFGVDLNPSSDNAIVGNNITGNITHDIMIRSSSDGNVLTNNEITMSNYGVRLYSSANNTFNGNLIEYTVIGFDITNSTGNSLYQNSFMDNGQHVQFYEQGLTNTWDEGNVTGGNYWDNYTGVDSNQDGIGDSPQVLDSSNQDNYPLMGKFSAFTISAGNELDVTSNSTVENLRYFSSNNSIILLVTNVTGNQREGFCRLTIPHSVLTPPYIVTIDSNSVDYVTAFENSATSIIYFSYQHSTIEITVVPEYPWFFFLALAAGTALLSMMVYRRDRQRKRFIKASAKACVTS